MQNPPAHAGNTLDKNATVTIAQDHPRLRGEYNHIKIDGQEYLGSPPLARGIHFLRKQSEPEIPITPACAGNTHSCFHGKAILWDHPRLRGEYTVCGTIEENAMGSPPLARGIPCDFEHKIMCIGITPAYAGNTPFSALSLLPSRDHPRLRGEYASIPRYENPCLGSPPLTRGILQHDRSSDRYRGITPAYAGNTKRHSGTES